MKHRLIRFVSLALVVALAFSFAGAWAAERVFRIYTIEANGTKFWLPSTLVVKKGDKVRIEAQTRLEGQASIHGLWLPDFNIKEQIDNKTKSVEFVADKAGIFAISCHMHPPHVGSQLVVLE
ncbi:MAG: cupredoxin domain-containing protein [Oligoflexia bacterium]